MFNLKVKTHENTTADWILYKRSVDSKIRDVFPLFVREKFFQLWSLKLAHVSVPDIISSNVNNEYSFELDEFVDTKDVTREQANEILKLAIEAAVKDGSQFLKAIKSEVAKSSWRKMT